MKRIESELRGLPAYGFGPPESVDAIRTRARHRRQRNRIAYATTIVLAVALVAAGVALTRADTSRSVVASAGDQQQPPVPAAEIIARSDHGLVALDSEGRELRTLYPTVDAGFGRLSMTDDGSAIYTTGNPIGLAVLCPGGGSITGEVVRLSADGAAPERIATGWLPVVSRDGRQLAYVAQSCDGPWVLTLSDLDSGEMMTVPQPSFVAAQPLAWSPDGNHLLFGSNSGGDATSTRLETIDRKTGDVRNLPVDVPGRITNATYLPTGDLAVQYVTTSGSQRVAAIGTDGTVERTLFEASVPDSGAIGPLTWSLDADLAGRVLVTYERGVLQIWTPGQADPATIEGVYSNAAWRQAVPASDPSAVAPSGSSVPQNPSVGRWSVVEKADAGIGASGINAAASDGTVALAGGERHGGQTGSMATIWRSTDGLHWDVVATPADADTVTALGVHGNVALAVAPGDRANATGTSAVWRSKDAGKTWVEAASGQVFGTPAPKMGRPYIQGLLWRDDEWIAYGARSDGYAGIWISGDGDAWEEVLGPNDAGAIEHLVVAPDGSLVASWGNRLWRATDPRDRGQVAIAATPKPYSVDSISPRLDIAFAQSTDKHGQPTPLLRSRDAGRTWNLDDGFLDTFPDARVLSIDEYAGRQIAAGWDGNTLSAWSSVDGITWNGFPSAFRQSPGGMLRFVVGVGDRIAVLGSAPELERYYVLDLTAPQNESLSIPPNAVDCVSREVIDGLTADGLPPLERAVTSETEITDLARTYADRIHARYPNVIDIGIGPGWGRAWTKDGDIVRVVPVNDYAIIATVRTAADCPAIPGYAAGMERATIFFRHE